MSDPVAEYQTDHDLLVTLNERVANLVKHVAEVVGMNKTLADDHEKRIRDSESAITTMKASHTMWRYILSTAISIVGLAVGVIGLILANT